MGFLFICKLRLVLPIGTTFHSQEGELRIVIENINFRPMFNSSDLFLIIKEMEASNQHGFHIFVLWPF